MIFDPILLNKFIVFLRCNYPCTNNNDIVLCALVSFPHHILKDKSHILLDSSQMSKHCSSAFAYGHAELFLAWHFALQLDKKGEYQKACFRATNKLELTQV